MVQPSHEAAHATLRKYQLKSVGGFWKARVPYGSWNIFATWEEGAKWLTEKRRARLKSSRKLSAARESVRTPNES